MRYLEVLCGKITMFPVCSTAPSVSSHCLISTHVGSKASFPLRNSIKDGYIYEDRASLGVPNGFHTTDISFKTNATKNLCMHTVDKFDQWDSTDPTSIPHYQNKFDDIVHSLSNECIYTKPLEQSLLKPINGPYPMGEKLYYVEGYSVSGQGEQLLGDELGNATLNELNSQSNMAGLSEGFSNLPDPLSQSTSILSDLSTVESLSTSKLLPDMVLEKPTLGSDTLVVDNDALSRLKENLDGVLAGIGESVDTSINMANNSIKNTYDAINSSVTNTVKIVTELLEGSVGGLRSSADNTGESVNKKLMGLTTELIESTSKAGTVAIDILRKGVIGAEDSFAKASTFAFYSYGSAKALLPPETRDVLSVLEGRATEVLKPVTAALQQVYGAVEGLERFLGFDPNDPIVPFVLFLGSSATLVIFYRAFKYGGYAGDLSPTSTLELLFRDDSVVLVDIRPEDMKDRDGLPDIRRGARFRYASLSLPEVDASVKKLLKYDRDVDDALLAAVIRNLKIVQDRSKVIVMDANGSRSRGVARALRKLGIERSYLVQGGFRSWGKDGLRIKENKPETALTVLNEEAAAILEDIKPTPVKVIGYSAGLLAGVYALLEWERTLQLIGLIGLGQTIYRRVASYEDVDNLKQDLRLLWAPVRVASQMVTWATGKLEPNKIGLPTSPSSTEVQSRVLQAAAKHESQPSDTGESQEASLELPTTSENLDLSEA